MHCGLEGLIDVPYNTEIINKMLRGLSSGIVYTANLILIRRFVNSKVTKNAVALSGAFRLASSVIIPRFQDLDDTVHQGGIMMFLGILSGILIVLWGPKKSKERAWDDYYESYFEQNNIAKRADDQSLFYKARYFILALGMRLPDIFLNNTVTKSIQLGFLESFSGTVTSYYFIVTTICILSLLLTAFNSPSSRHSGVLKFLILPCSYLIFILLLVNIPLIYVFLQYHGGISLMSLVIINVLIDFVFSAALFYLLDTLLVQSNLSNLNTSLIIALEFVIIILIENVFKNGEVLKVLTIQGYYGLLAGCMLVPMFLYHKEIED